MLGLGVYKGVKAAGQESYIACFLWGRRFFCATPVATLFGSR
jgi:hypothetical protein